MTMSKILKIVSIFTVFILIMSIFLGISYGSELTGIRGTRGSWPTLTNAGVSPSTGNSSTKFTFFVTYTDADGDMPITCVVYIDGTPHNMTQNGSNAKTGIPCYYITTLSAGNHSYAFFAENTFRESVTNPKNTSYYLDVSSGSSGYPPQLLNPQYSPSRPIANQTINFTVQYKDLDNDAPDFVNLEIWQNKTGTSGSSWVYNTTVVGTNYTSGVVCYKTITLNTGMYYFRFKTSSKKDSVVSGGNYLYVAPSSNYPVLKYGTVSPAKGTNQTLFNYTICYQDGNFGAAKVSLVFIDDVKHTMTEVKGDAGSEGVYYSYTKYLSNGNHTYYFIFSDGKTNISYPTSGKLKGPVVGPAGKTPPYLSGGNVSPMRGTSYKTLFNYTVVYQDGNFGEANVRWVIIDNWTYNMSKDYVSSSGVHYIYSTCLSAGPHSYYFKFSDGRVFIRYPASGFLLGPYGMGPDSNSNRPPSASLLVSPVKAPVNTTFYFNGSGVDPDRNNITFSWTFSDGYNVSGKQNIVRKFFTPGNYSVTLTVKDIWGLWGTASAKFIVTGSNIPPKNNPPVIITNLKSKNYAKLNSTVFVSALRSYDLDGDKLSFQWLITNPSYNYSTNKTIAAFNYTFKLSGNFTFKLTVSDGKASTVATYKFQCNGTGTPSRNQKPVAKPSVTVRGMVAYLSGAGSYDPDGTIISYSWKVGSSTYKGKYHNHTFNSYGYKTATLTVKDNGGLTDSKIVGFYIYNRTRPNGTKMENLDYNITNIGSHIELSGSAIENVILTIISSGFDFQITLIESRKNYLKFLVESDSETGRLVIIDINNNLIDLSNLDLVKLKIDDSTIVLTDFEEIIKVTGETPYYNIISDEGKYQLLVYFPHFSQHTLEIKVQDKGQGEQNGHIDMSVMVWPVILIVIVILIIIILIVFQEIRKKKSEKEFYYDFRVAEDRTSNGVHTKGEKAAEEDEDWDDFI